MDLICPACGNTVAASGNSGKAIHCGRCGHSWQPTAPEPLEPSQVSEPPEQPQVSELPAIPGRDWGAFISPLPRMKLAMALAAVFLCVNIAFVAVNGRRLDMIGEGIALENAQAGVTPEVIEWERKAQASDAFHTMFAGVWLVALGAYAVCFWIWKYRAYKNLPSLKAAQIRSTPGGTFGWYFCPFLSLWKPCQLMHDIWHGSNADVNRERSIALVVFWWFAFLGTILVGHISNAIPEGTLSDLRLSTSVHTGFCILHAITAGLAICLISGISRGQHKRNAVLAAQVQTPPFDQVPPVPFE